MVEDWKVKNNVPILERDDFYNYQGWIHNKFPTTPPTGAYFGYPHEEDKNLEPLFSFVFKDFGSFE